MRQHEGKGCERHKLSSGPGCFRKQRAGSDGSQRVLTRADQRCTSVVDKRTIQHVSPTSPDRAPWSSAPSAKVGSTPPPRFSNASTRQFQPCPYTPPRDVESEDALSSSWWSIPQAIVWIVTRSDAHLLRADGVRTMAGVSRMKGIRAAALLDGPPVSLASAANELLHAWRAGRIALFGCKWGKGLPRSIAARSDLRLRDYCGEMCLGEGTLYFDTHPFWSSLSVRTDDCTRCWPIPPTIKEPGSRPRPAARRPSDSEVLAFIEETRQALRAERKRAGRDVLLRAATNHFDLSRKIALDIRNSAARDHKGGRPKNSKPGTARPILK